MIFGEQTTQAELGRSTLNRLNGPLGDALDQSSGQW